MFNFAYRIHQLLYMKVVVILGYSNIEHSEMRLIGLQFNGYDISSQIFPVAQSTNRRSVNFQRETYPHSPVLPTMCPKSKLLSPCIIIPGDMVGQSAHIQDRYSAV